MLCHPGTDRFNPRLSITQHSHNVRPLLTPPSRQPPHVDADTTESQLIVQHASNDTKITAVLTNITYLINNT